MSLPPEDQSTLKELYDDVLSSKSHVDYSLSVINDLEEQRDSLTEQLKQTQKQLDEAINKQLLSEKEYQRKLYEEGEENDGLRQQIQDLQSSLSTTVQEASRLQQLQQEYDEQKLELQKCREQLDLFAAQQEQLQKLEVLCDRYKDRVESMRDRCEAVESLQQEVDRLRSVDVELVQKTNELKDVQMRLTASERGLVSVSAQLADAVSENEVLKAELKAEQDDTIRYRQQLKATTTQESPLKRPRLETALSPLLEVSPQL